MKRRITTLVIVLAMLLTLLPTTAFAAESLGIYVGSTEVTTANYQNITGPGISGKVYYDPQTHALVLENATVTSYPTPIPPEKSAEMWRVSYPCGTNSPSASWAPIPSSPI